MKLYSVLKSRFLKSEWSAVKCTWVNKLFFCTIWTKTQEIEHASLKKGVSRCRDVIFVLFYLVLQIAAVLIRLSDLLFQLPAVLVLIGQPFSQYLVPLSGFIQLLHCCCWFHLHSLSHILAEGDRNPNTEALSPKDKNGGCYSTANTARDGKLHCWLMLLKCLFSNHLQISCSMVYLYNRLLSLLSVQLQLQLPHSVLSFPQLLRSSPLTLLTPSLQLWNLLGTLLQGAL